MDGCHCAACGASIETGPAQPIIVAMWSRGRWWCRVCAEKELGFPMPPPPAGPLTADAFGNFYQQLQEVNAKHPPFFTRSGYVGRVRVRGWG